MNSPGHRANILEQNVNAIGVGLYVAPNTGYKNFWVLDFGSVIDTPPPGGAPTKPAGPPPPITVDVSPAAISGEIPTQGVALVIVLEQAESDRVIATALAAGCSRPSVWVTVKGFMFGFVGGAPPFVNKVFPGLLEANRPMLIACG